MATTWTREKIVNQVWDTVTQQWRDGRAAGEIRRDVFAATIDVWDDFKAEEGDREIVLAAADECIATLFTTEA